MSSDSDRFAGQRPNRLQKRRREIEEAMTTFSLWREHAVELAEHRRQMFAAYMGAGFTEAQALELCRSFP
ncbi:hypothetical protein O4H52_08075 [Sphingomonadaceae bacterium G21617-S1]|nr:hypothetical protein [Sphingomonadaceae bacterium G21617-S1]